MAVGGLVSSIKPMLAEAVSRGLGLPVIASDRTRKWLAGVGPPIARQAEAYSPAVSAETFDEVFRRAALVLKSSRGVILDATFRGRGLRRARPVSCPPAQGGRSSSSRPSATIACSESDCASARPAPRCRTPAEDLLARVRAEFEPVAGLPAGEHLVVDTTHPPTALAERVRAAVAGLRGPH